jgi:hypothetical protein
MSRNMVSPIRSRIFNTTGQCRTLDWDFVIAGVNTQVKMNGIVSVNDADAYLHCGLQGLGLIRAPLYMALPYLGSGQLIEVLSQLHTKPEPISVVYLHNRHLSPKVRAFVDWVAELFASCPLMSKKPAEVTFDSRAPHEVRIQHRFQPAPPLHTPENTAIHGRM